MASAIYMDISLMSKKHDSYKAFLAFLIIIFLYLFLYFIYIFLSSGDIEWLRTFFPPYNHLLGRLGFVS